MKAATQLPLSVDVSVKQPECWPRFLEFGLPLSLRIRASYLDATNEIPRILILKFLVLLVYMKVRRTWTRRRTI